MGWVKVKLIFLFTLIRLLNNNYQCCSDVSYHLKYFKLKKEIPATVISTVFLKLLFHIQLSEQGN